MFIHLSLIFIIFATSMSMVFAQSNLETLVTDSAEVSLFTSKRRNNVNSDVPKLLCPEFLCTERPHILAFQYTSASCDSSSNEQGNKFTCTDDTNYDDIMTGAHIHVSNKKSNEVYFNGWVETGSVFHISNYGSKLPADTVFEIFVDPTMNVLLQSMSVHTSCSKKLSLGDRFGGLILAGLRYEKGDALECLIEISPSSAPSQVPSVAFSMVPSLLPSYSPSSSPTGSVYPTTLPSIDSSPKPTTIPTLIPSLPPTTAPSPLPTFDPSSNPSQPPTSSPTICQQSMCLERPVRMMFVFDGGNCQSSENTQEPGKFSCIDLNNMMPSSKLSTTAKHIVFSDPKQNNNKSKAKKKNTKKKSNTKANPKQNNNKSKAMKKNTKKKKSSKAKNAQVKKKSATRNPKCGITTDSIDFIYNENTNIIDEDNFYFDGMVEIGMVFEVGTGSNKLPANMEIHVYDESGMGNPVLLQKVQFHSSCSQNLYIGDKFGSVKLVGFMYRDGTEEFCID